MQNQQDLYNEVISNYKSCSLEKENLADTWVHTLEQRGKLFPLEDMKNLYSHGNKIRSRVLDCNWLIDQSALDLKEPVVVELLKNWRK